MRSHNDKARRIYHDLVRGRTKVRVVEPIPPAFEFAPVFLVGAYRSGTTLLRLIVDSHSEIACPPETTHLAHLKRIVEAPASLAGLESLGFGEEQVVARLRIFAAGLHETYAASVGKPRWADKSPEYVWHLEWLLRLFPEAKFVLLVRHVLDQVSSHVRSGHDLGARLGDDRVRDEDLRVTAARYWTRAVEAQLQFRDAHPGSCLVVRYEDLCSEPQQAVKGVFQFCGVGWEPEALRFFEKQHDFGLSDSRARTSSSIEIRTQSFDDWPSDVIDACLDIARPTLARLGWSPAQPG